MDVKLTCNLLFLRAKRVKVLVPDDAASPREDVEMGDDTGDAAQSDQSDATGSEGSDGIHVDGESQDEQMATDDDAGFMYVYSHRFPVTRLI